MAVVHLDLAGADLAGEGRVGAEQQLLSGLATGIKRTAHLNPTKGAVVEQATVFAGKGHALGDALVDDGCAHLCKAEDVAFAGTVVTAFDGIIKQTIGAIAVISVVFGSIDTALGSNRVRATGAILKAKCLDIVTQFGQARCC